MNKPAIEKIRKQLQKLKSELLLMQDEFKEAGETVDLDQTRVGRLSRMDAMQDTADGIGICQKTPASIGQD